MKALYLIVILAISVTTGCSHSKAPRQDRAYAKYVKKSKNERKRQAASIQGRAYAKYLKKSKIEREKRQAAFRKQGAKIPERGTETLPPQEMTQVSHTSEGPQAIPSEPSN